MGCLQPLRGWCGEEALERSERDKIMFPEYPCARASFYSFCFVYTVYDRLGATSQHIIEALRTRKPNLAMLKLSGTYYLQVSAPNMNAYPKARENDLDCLGHQCFRVNISKWHCRVSSESSSGPFSSGDCTRR